MQRHVCGRRPAVCEHGNCDSRTGSQPNSSGPQTTYAHSHCHLDCWLITRLPMISAVTHDDGPSNPRRRHQRPAHRHLHPLALLVVLLLSNENAEEA